MINSKPFEEVAGQPEFSLIELLCDSYVGTKDLNCSSAGKKPSD
jgi:hypothetical protein